MAQEQTALVKRQMCSFHAIRRFPLRLGRARWETKTSSWVLKVHCRWGRIHWIPGRTCKTKMKHVKSIESTGAPRGFINHFATMHKPTENCSMWAIYPLGVGEPSFGGMQGQCGLFQLRAWRPVRNWKLSSSCTVIGSHKSRRRPDRFCPGLLHWLWLFAWRPVQIYRAHMVSENSLRL